MKKIIAIAVILAGVVLFTIGNTIQMYSTISIIEKRLADKEHAVDTVSTKVESDTMSFTEDSLKLTEYVKEHWGTEYLTVGYVINNQVFVDKSGYIPVIRYKNGMPKIAVSYDINGKTMLGKITGKYLFFDQSGRVIAYGEMPFMWTCSKRGDDKAPLISGSNPNMCRDFYAIRNQM